MEKKLQQHLDKAFAPYGEFPARADVMQELLSNLTEKYHDLKSQGKSQEEAYQATIDSIGEVSEIMDQVPHEMAKSKAESNLKTALSDIGDLVGINTGNNKFKHITLAKADLSETDLSGEIFAGSELKETSFRGSTLVDAKFRAVALKGANFTGANLTNATFGGSDLNSACFDNANLTSAKLKGCGLNGATFKDATLVGTDFSQSDLTKISFDGQALDGVVFDSTSLKQTSFRNAKLRDVSFHHAAVKHAIFDGATMDKITYAILKGAKATLNNVIIV